MRKISDPDMNSEQFECSGAAAGPGSTRHTPVTKAQRMVSKTS